MITLKSMTRFHCYQIVRRTGFAILQLKIVSLLPKERSIGIYCLKSGRCNQEIYISKKAHGNKQDNHHINDLCIFGNSLFVSMFSISGNWTNECYDGGVVEIDLASSAENIEFTSVIQNLWMPHSVGRFRVLL